MTTSVYAEIYNVIHEIISLVEGKNFHRRKSLNPHKAKLTALVRDIIPADKNRLATAARQSYQKIKARFKGEFFSFFDQYEQGKITKNQLAYRLKAAIKSAYEDAYALGQKSIGYDLPLTKEDYRWLKGARAQENKYLNRFIDDVVNNRLRMPQDERANMYVDTLDFVYNHSRVEAAPDDSIIYWVLGHAEHCGDCLTFAAASPYTKKSLPAVPRDGTSICLSNCKCSLIIKKQTKIIPDDEEPGKMPPGVVPPGKKAPVVPIRRGTIVRHATAGSRINQTSPEQMRLNRAKNYDISATGKGYITVKLDEAERFGLRAVSSPKYGRYFSILGLLLPPAVIAAMALDDDPDYQADSGNFVFEGDIPFLEYADHFIAYEYDRENDTLFRYPNQALMREAKKKLYYFPVIKSELSVSRMLKKKGIVKAEKVETRLRTREILKGVAVSLTELIEGGPGSGHWGHKGRKGKRGGSLPVITKTVVGRKQKATKLGTAETKITPVLDHNSHDKLNKFMEFRLYTIMERSALKHKVVMKLSRQLADDNEAWDAYWHAYGDIAALSGWSKDNVKKKDKIEMIYAKVNDIVGQWAVTSGDKSPSSLALQIAAHREFLSSKEDMPNLLFSSLEPVDIERAKENYRITGRFKRKVLRQIYNNTQKELAKKGIKKLTLHRGMIIWDEARFRALVASASPVTDVVSNPMSAFSGSRGVARSFAETFGYGGVVLSGTVPASAVLSTAKTGLGCLKEFEYILLSTNGKALSQVIF